MKLGNSLQQEKIITKDFVLICAANFFIFLGFQMTLPTIPLFVGHLGGSDQLIGWAVGFFTFSALFIRSFAGNALETKGRKIVYVSGLVLFIITVGSYALISSLVLLFVIRLFQGIGWGASTTASGTIASDIIPASRRGEGMGWYTLGGSVALAIGPAAALMMNKSVSFPVIFLICAACGVIATILSLKITYKKIDPEAAKAASKERQFFEKSVWKPTLLMFFVTFSFGGIVSFLPFYTKQEGVGGIELYFTLYALALISTRFFAGRLYDRKGLKIVLIPGFLMIMVAMLMLAWLPNTVILLIAAVIYGLGFGIIQPALNAWTIALAPVKKRGLAVATLFSSFDLGVGVGAVVNGQVSHFWNYQAIYLVSATSLACALLAFLLMVKNKKEKVS